MNYAYLKENKVGDLVEGESEYAVIRVDEAEVEAMKSESPDKFEDATYEEWYAECSDEVKAKLDAGEEI